MTRSIPAAIAAATLVLLASPRPTHAQESPARRNGWELIASSGALVPANAQRSALRDAALSTAQLSYVIGQRVAVTTMFGWARSRDLASAGAPKLDVYTYDVGAEARAPRWLEGKVASLTPFVGAGVGGRSYDHRKLDVAATHALAGYGAAGGELGVGRVRLRLEVRDYVTAFKPLVGAGSAAMRHEVMAMAGLRFTRHASRED